MSAYFLHQPSKTTLNLHPSVQSTPRSSTSTERSSVSYSEKTPMVSSQNNNAKDQSKPQKLLQSIKKGWKEHHESVQGAYELYYGQGAQTGRILRPELYGRKY